MRSVHCKTVRNIEPVQCLCEYVCTPAPCSLTTMSSANSFAALASPAPVATPTPSFRAGSSTLGSKCPHSPSSSPPRAPWAPPCLPLLIMPWMAQSTQYLTSKTSFAVAGLLIATTLLPMSSLQHGTTMAILLRSTSFPNSTLR